jgi:low affinity Fe/Cu permease
MSSHSAAAQGSQPLLSRPSNTVAYVTILAALVSAAIHLFLAPSVIGFSQTTGILFYLNGFGWIGGILVFLSRFWRHEFYLVTTGYALVTIIAFFVMGSGLDGLAITAKIAEGVVAVTATYLYTAENPAQSSFRGSR